MVIANTNVKNVYEGNGVTTEWPITFELDPIVSKVKIVLEDSDGVITDVSTGYSVADNVVTYPTVESGLPAVASGVKVVISRETPRTQEIDLTAQGVLDAETLEEGFDKLTMQVQELADGVNRAIKLPISNTTGSEYYKDPLESIEEAKDTAIAEINTEIGKATEEVEKAKQQVVLAQEAVVDAKEQADFAEAQVVLAEEQVERAKGYVTQAQSKAVEAEESAQQALQASSNVEQLVNDVKIPSYNFVTYVVGTPKGDYNGSLRTFPTLEAFVSDSTYVYVNGVYKERGEEYVEDSGLKSITFGFDLVKGDTVILITSIGWFSKKDIVTFNEAVSNHNMDNNSHADIRAMIEGLGFEANSTITLGVFDEDKSFASSQYIEFEGMPTSVSLRFSNLEQKLWINCMSSTAGIEKISDNKYRIYYNISCEDFKSQSAIKGPFVIQYCIKYLGKTESIANIIDEHNTSIEAHQDIRNLIASEKGLAEIVVKETDWETYPIGSGTFRTNLGTDAPIRFIKLELGDSIGSKWISMPASRVGYGNRNGNFVDIYYNYVQSDASGQDFISAPYKTKITVFY